MNFVNNRGVYISDSFGPNPVRGCYFRLLLGPTGSASEYLVSNDRSGLLVVGLRVLHDPVHRPVQIDDVSPLVGFQWLLELHQDFVQLCSTKVLQVGMRLIWMLPRCGIILDLRLTVGGGAPQVFLVLRGHLMQIFRDIVEFTVYSVKVLVEVRTDVSLYACDDNGF